MQVEIVKRPANSAAKIKLGPGESITAEAGAMISMSSDITVTTTTHKKEGGGLLKGLKRMLAGENLFLNHFSAGNQGGDLYLSTTLPGDMECIELDGTKKLKVQAGSFVAHDPGISMDISFEGMKTLFSGENMIWLSFSGSGKVIINAFGAIYPVQIDGEYIVDTGNVAAYDESLTFKITKASKSLVSSVLGGEGLVCRFSGKGTVYCQTHSDGVFGKALGPLLRPKEQ